MRLYVLRGELPSAVGIAIAGIASAGIALAGIAIADMPSQGTPEVRKSVCGLCNAIYAGGRTGERESGRASAESSGNQPESTDIPTAEAFRGTVVDNLPKRFDTFAAVLLGPKPGHGVADVQIESKKKK
jgi:hypothetical protein